MSIFEISPLLRFTTHDVLGETCEKAEGKTNRRSAYPATKGKSAPLQRNSQYSSAKSS
jgi:hypothetical protein